MSKGFAVGDIGVPFKVPDEEDLLIIISKDRASVMAKGITATAACELCAEFYTCDKSRKKDCFVHCG